MKTGSYSLRLRACSVPYRTFNQVLKVRIVTGEYLIAMKLRAGRKYKYDLSDIVGILSEQKRMGEPITYEMIDTAVKNLYGGWDGFSDESVAFLQGILSIGDYAAVYEQIRESELHAKEILLDFQKDYPGVLKAENLDKILEQKSQQQKTSVLTSLRKRRDQISKETNLSMQ